MRTGAALALVLTVGLGGLGGCSQDPEGVRADYCDSVADHQVELTEILADDEPDALLRAVPVFRELDAEAPRDIVDEWDALLDALEGLDEALEAAGVDPGDYRADQPPAGVSQEQQQAIARAADQLFRPEVAAAYEGVKQHAKDVCGTPLFR